MDINELKVIIENTLNSYANKPLGKKRIKEIVKNIIKNISINSKEAKQENKAKAEKNITQKVIESKSGAKAIVAQPEDNNPLELEPEQADELNKDIVAEIEGRGKKQKGNPCIISYPPIGNNDNYVPIRVDVNR